MKQIIIIMLLFSTAVRAEKPQEFVPESLVPAYIPVDRPGLQELTDDLRGRFKTLGLNGKGKVSRALLLLPLDRSGPGALSFEIEGGERPGVYQCEALGRGLTYTEPRARAVEGKIAGVRIYYAPKDMAGGATVPGVYDIRNITPAHYDIMFLNKPEKELLARTARPEKTPKKQKRLFSAVWSSWYPKGSAAEPVDMIWAADAQAGSQGKGVPFFELPPSTARPEEASMRARQLAANPNYYRGPYGRYGFAVHTDRWEEPQRLADPKYEGRPERTDFRWRDTNGCVKLRPSCLELLNEFIAEQAGKRRRVMLEVYETAALDGLPTEPPSAGSGKAPGGRE